MSLIRALIPSWRFFDGLESVTELQVRVSAGKDQGFGHWRPVLPPNEPRSFGALFFNPQGNLRLACLSLVERLTEEENVTTESLSYRLVENLVRYWLQKSESECVTGARFQFRIILDGKDVLVSREHAVP